MRMYLDEEEDSHALVGTDAGVKDLTVAFGM